MNQNTNAYVIEKDPKYNVPTDKLLQKFPIIYQTPAESDLAKKVQNRMLNGFNTWNMGYEAWEHWGEVLYHPGSLYNVHGVHFTLKEYQQSMNFALAATDIQMGDFQNMIFADDWTAIRYETVNIDRKTGKRTPADVTEFVRFGDYGELGAKVEEGWGGVKCETFAGMSSFQTEEERSEQKRFMDQIAATVLPETDDLNQKYPIVFPTTIPGEKGQKIKELLLQDFEHWNNGFEKWSQWADEFYTKDVNYDLKRQKVNLDGLKTAIRKEMEANDIKRVRINNILISEDWAAIHFWDVTTSPSGEKDVNNHMYFLHFVNDSGSLKADMVWAR